jgi:ABC-2 type transport system permease protein
MNLFKRELRKNRKSFIIWTIIILCFCVYALALYPTMANQADKLKDLIKSYPKGLMDAFNMNKLDMANILGFFGMESYLFITLLGSIYVALLAAGIVSKEEDEGTIEFLMAKPVSRNSILTSKMLCILFYIVVLNLCIFVFNYVGFEAVKKGEYDKTGFLLLSVAPLLLNLTFAALGLILSMFVVKAKNILSASIGLVLGTYFIGIVSTMSSKAELLKYFSPFKYVDAGDLITNKKIDGVYLIIMGLIIIVSVVSTYIVYNKKDIR